MKTFCSILIFLLISSLLLSCSKDDDGEIIKEFVTAQLFEDTSIMENSPTAEFNISLDKPAPENGFIILQVSSTNNAEFETNPPLTDGEIEIPVLKGRSSVTLEFSPQNNALLQEDQLVTIKLLESSDQILFGNKKITTIEIADDEAPVSVSFNYPLPAQQSLREIDAEGISVNLELSQPAPGEGSVVIQLEGNENNYFVSTSPALNAEQEIIIPIETGITSKTFQIYPKDNNLLENHKTLKLKIISTEGAVTTGSHLEKEVVVLDDEIEGKIKSVQSVSVDGKRTKKTWEYTTNGKVNKILWEIEDGQLYTRADNYNYGNNGEIQFITTVTGDWEAFTWQNGKIVLSEKVSGFFKMGYSTYEYNAVGKIRKKTVYALNQDNSTYDQSARHDYEYFTDGSLKKETIYVAGNNNTWILHSSIIFDGYTGKINPAPIEIVPTQNVQQFLPLHYAQQGDGVNLSTYYIYEFNSEGMVTKRISSTETTTYSYY